METTKTQKFINGIALFTSLVLAMAVLAPASIISTAGIGNLVMDGLRTLCGGYVNGFLMVAVALLIVLPAGLGCTYAYCWLYFKAMNRVKIPFVNGSVAVYGRR